MARKKATDAVLKRSEELDALDAVLPFNRRDQLAALLTDDDVATLKHLAGEGMGENTLKALASDLSYLEAWCQLATGDPLPWPAPESLLLKFVAHHLWDPAKRSENPAHSGLTGAFAAPSLKSALRLAVRASARPRQRKSKKAVTADVLAQLLLACTGESLVDVRDRALLLIAFASGGRRRSEVAALRVEDLTDEDPVQADPANSGSPPLPFDPHRPHEDDHER